MSHVPAARSVHWQVREANPLFAIEALVVLFLIMFRNVARVNRQNPSTGWGFADTGALVEDFMMLEYNSLLSRLTPYNHYQFHDHCVWVRRSVSASLRVALDRLWAPDGLSQSLHLAPCNHLVLLVADLFVTMANSVLDNVMTIDHGDDDDEEECVEEEGGDEEDGEEEELEEHDEPQDDQDGVNINCAMLDRLPTIDMWNVELDPSFPNLDRDEEEEELEEEPAIDDTIE